MKRVLAVLLSCLLFHSVLMAEMAGVPARPSKQAIKVADAVQRLGTGENAVVAVRLRDKTTVKGHIAAIEADGFVVSDPDCGTEQPVMYGAVTRLVGVNLANGTQVRVGGGFKAKLASVAKVLSPVHKPGRNNLTGGEKTLLIGIGIGVLLAIILAKAL